MGLFLLGCDDEKPEVTNIDKTRVLAARVEVAGEPERVSPAPGESVTVSFLVVAPEPDPLIAYALCACVAADSVSDLVSCAGEPLAVSSSTEPVLAAPAVEFEVPAEGTASGRLAVVGAVCSAGVALAAEDGSRCADGSRSLGMTVDFPLAEANAPNTNPTLAALFLDGSELPVETGSELDCAALPTVASGSKSHAFEVELAENSRDPLPVVASADPPRESLLVSYFTTRGELDHAYSSLPGTSAELRALARWDAPSVAEPTLARLIAVVRDGRAGSDFAERRVCVVP